MSNHVEYRIHGDDMQLVEVFIDASQTVRAEVGAMMFMDGSIHMDTNTGGGLRSGFKRMVSGESFFITSFRYAGAGKGSVAFGAPYPGKIVCLDLAHFGNQFLCQKDSFLCCSGEIDISVAFTKKIGAGIFGGEGFILQKLAGTGLAFVHAGGTIIERELAPGQTLLVDTGSLVGLTAETDFDIQFVGGIKNALFGGEGMFFTKLTGPGKVYLQSLPFSRLADRVNSAVSLASADTGKRGLLR